MYLKATTQEEYKLIKQTDIDPTSAFSYVEPGVDSKIFS
jgi:hypothetical protein